ncbi:MAG: peroxiredoxin family protein [Phycisphaerae bacterium]
MSELRGLGDVHSKLSALGGRLFGVSVDPPSKAKAIVERNDLPFSILCDTDRKIIEAFGLVHKGGSMDGQDIPIPAHVLIGPSGEIVWRFTSHRVQVRPAPADVLRAIEDQNWKPRQSG